MRMTSFAAVALALFLAATPARADLTGQSAPDAALKAAWNAKGEKALKDFKGRVVLLELFATW